MTDIIEAYRHLYLIASISIGLNVLVLAVLIWDGMKRPARIKRPPDMADPIDWNELRKLW